MTRRVPILHKAAPESYVEINPDDAGRMGIVNGAKVKISSRRGSVVMKASINGRGRPPRGMVFVPFFDESYLINEVTLDAFCPISKQPDYKKCAVKLEKV
jgi:nitrate reductase NapA